MAAASLSRRAKRQHSHVDTRSRRLIHLSEHLLGDVGIEVRLTALLAEERWHITQNGSAGTSRRT